MTGEMKEKIHNEIRGEFARLGRNRASNINAFKNTIKKKAGGKTPV